MLPAGRSAPCASCSNLSSRNGERRGLRSRDRPPIRTTGTGGYRFRHLGYGALASVAELALDTRFRLEVCGETELARLAGRPQRLRVVRRGPLGEDEREPAARAARLKAE